MKKYGVLNSEIAKVLSDMGHTDQICISDCGLPIPISVKKIDLSIELGKPSFIDVLRVVSSDMEIEKIILASEIKEFNLNILNEIKKILPDVDITFVKHEEFKEITKLSKAVIRTGEATPYANIILISGVIFKSR